MLIVTIISLVLIIISVINLVFTIQYLGPTFGRTHPVDVNDWRRKWLLFFAWFSLVSSSINLLFYNNSLPYNNTTTRVVTSELHISHLGMILGILPLITNIFVIIYLGPTFDRTKKIPVDNWMRKWVLFFAWFNIVLFGTAFGIGALNFINNR